MPGLGPGGRRRAGGRASPPSALVRAGSYSRADPSGAQKAKLGEAYFPAPAPRVASDQVEFGLDYVDTQTQDELAPPREDAAPYSRGPASVA